MDTDKKASTVEVPKWDVALAALVQEEYGKAGKGLSIDHLHSLAKAHAIRFDDLMDTMFKLCLHGAWRYQDYDGIEQALTPEMVQELFKQGRLDEKKVAELTGHWGPLE